MSESGGSRVCFEAEAGADEEGGGGEEEDEDDDDADAGAGAQGRRQGKVTVKYNRQELQRRLDLEGWVDERLLQLYACPEEEMPELEIDIDHLLELNTDEERAEQLREILQACTNSPEGFIADLLSSLKGMKKLNNGSRK